MTTGGAGRQILRGGFGGFGGGGVGDGARLVRGRRGSLRQAGGLIPSMWHKGRRLRASMGWEVMRDWVSASSSRMSRWLRLALISEPGNMKASQPKLLGGWSSSIFGGFP